MITKRLSLVILCGLIVALIVSGGCIQIVQSPFDPENPNYKEPEISDVNVTPSLDEEAKTAEVAITWTTDRQTKSIVRYGVDEKLESEAEEGGYSEEHSITLKGLKIDTTYRFKIESRDRSGREPGIYEGEQFTTPGASSLTEDGWKSYPDNLDEAVNVFERAVLLNPGHAGAYNGLGWSYGKKGEVEKAIANFIIAAGKDSGLTEAFVGLAGLYLTRGDGEGGSASDVDSAISAIDSALNLIGTSDSSYVCPHNPEVTIGSVYALRAKAYYAQGKLDESKSELEGALAKKPDNPAAADLKSWIQEAGL